MFDQTLLPEEDFSGGKLLRKRKTSIGSDEHQAIIAKRRRTTAPPPPSPQQQSQTTKTNDRFDEIQVSARPRTLALDRLTASQPTERTRHSAASMPSTPRPREFRARDKSISYTVPSLKSLLPTPPQKRKERRASLPIPPKPLDIPKLRPPDRTTPSASPRPVGRPPKLLRTETKRTGERTLIMKLRISPDKLNALLAPKQPRIRIVEGRRRPETEERDDLPSPKKDPEKPFGGILSKDDADVQKTTPTDLDRTRFDRARSVAAVPTSITVRSASEVSSAAGGAPIAETAFKVRAINFGNYRVKTHYASPYPEEYSRQSVLCICEFCLKYMSGDWVAWRHRVHPPKPLP
jgi:MYST family zinc finger domain